MYLALHRPSTKWSAAASFILKIKEKYCLSQAVIDTVLASTKSLIDGLLQDALREDLHEHAKAPWMKIEVGLLPFSGLEITKFMRQGFIQDFLLEGGNK